MTKTQAAVIFAESKGFSTLSYSGDKSWYNMVKDCGQYLIGLELDGSDNTFRLRYTIDISCEILYIKLGYHLLSDACFDHAVDKLENLAEKILR